MSRRIQMLRAVCAAVAALMAGCTVIPSLESDSPEEEIVRFYTDVKGDPSCSVACVREERAVFAGDPRALYRVGSLTKLFLRPAFSRLQEDGVIDLDSPVTRCAPFSLPDEYTSVTLRDLMENRSGLPREFLNPLNPLDAGRAFLSGVCGVSLYGGFETIPDFAEELRGWRARWHVRAREPQYSNVGFALLALSVENVAGRGLEEIFAERVARPCGLADTVFVPSESQAGRVLPPCAGDLPWMYLRGSEVPEHPLGPALRGTGGLFSTAADCARFFSGEWRYVDSLIAEKPLELCADLEDRGLLRVRLLMSGRRVLYRAGMIYGGASFVCFEPSSRTILVILRNVTSWPSDDDFIFADRISRGK